MREEGNTDEYAGGKGLPFGATLTSWSNGVVGTSLSLAKAIASHVSETEQLHAAVEAADIAAVQKRTLGCWWTAN